MKIKMRREWCVPLLTDIRDYYISVGQMAVAADIQRAIESSYNPPADNFTSVGA